MTDGWSSSPPESNSCPWEFAVHIKDAIDSLNSEGFVQPKQSPILLPHYKETRKIIDRYLSHIEMGIVTSVLVGEHSPGLLSYLEALSKFVHDYGLRFDEEKFDKITKLLFLVMTSVGQRDCVILKSAEILEKILRECDRMVYCDWQAMAGLYRRIKQDKINGGSVVTETMTQLKKFIPLEETESVLQYIHSLEQQERHTFYKLFIPVQGTAQEHMEKGAVHWWNTLWLEHENNENVTDLVLLFKELTYSTPDFTDWSAIYSHISERILRGTALSGKSSEHDEDFEIKIVLESYGKWAASLLGGPKSFQAELDLLMKHFDVFLCPQYGGAKSPEKILWFLAAVTEAVTERLLEETKGKRQVAKEFYLCDEDVGMFVSSMLKPTVKGLLNASIERRVASNIVESLAALRPRTVLPCILQLAYDLLKEGKDYNKDNFGRIMFCLERTFLEMVGIKGIFQEQLDGQATETSLSLRHQMTNLFHKLLSQICNDLFKTKLVIDCLGAMFYLLHENETEKLPECAVILMEKMLEIGQEVHHDKANKFYYTMSMTSAFRGMMITSSKSNTEILAEKLLTFVGSADFMSSLMTDVSSMMVREMVCFHPESFAKIAPVVVTRTLNLLSSGKPDKAGINFVVVASNISYTSAEIIVEHKQTLFNLIEALLNSDYSKVYEVGVKALKVVLAKLGRTYIMEKTITDKNERPYESGVSTVYWHVPDGSHKEVAKLLLQTFVFPALDKVNDPNLSGDSLLKQLSILCAWEAVPFFFPSPNDSYSPVPLFCAIPSVDSCPSGISRFTDMGEDLYNNFRLKLVDVCEIHTNRILREKRKENNKSLDKINALLSALLDQKGEPWDEHGNFAEFGVPFKFAGISGKFRIFDVNRLRGIGYEDVPICTPFKERISTLIFDIFGSVPTDDVGIQSVIRLFPNKSQMMLFLVRVLKESDPSYIYQEMSRDLLPDEDPFYGWKTLQTLPSGTTGIEEASYDCYFEAYYNVTFAQYKPGILEDYAQEAWQKTDKIGPWSKFKSEEALQQARKVNSEFRAGEEEFFFTAKNKKWDDSEDMDFSSASDVTDMETDTDTTDMDASDMDMDTSADTSDTAVSI